MSHNDPHSLSGASSPLRLLPGWLFYSVIGGGVIMGAIGASIATCDWIAQRAAISPEDAADTRPERTRLLPTQAAFIGATFGGLLGSAIAISLECLCQRVHSRRNIRDNGDRIHETGFSNSSLP
jgi:hypothetical protein